MPGMYSVSKLRRRGTIDEEEPRPLKRPARPDRMTMRTKNIFPTPRMLIMRRPVLWYRAWMKQISVMTLTAILRTFHRLASISRAYIMYSPKTMQFGVENPSRTT